MKTLLLVCIAIVSFVDLSLSQTLGSYGFSDAKSISLAKTYNARTFSTDAIGVNPSNLANSSEIDFTFTTFFPLPSINLNFNFPMNIDRYNYFFGGIKDSAGKTIGRPLTKEDTEELANLFREGEFVSNFNLNLLAFTIHFNKNIGTVGFAVSDYVSQRLKMSSAFTDFLFIGTKLQKEFPLSDLNINMSYLRQYSLSYGRIILENKNFVFNRISAGIGLKLVHGYYYLSTVKNDSYIKVNPNTFDVEGKWDYEVAHALPEDFGKNYGSDSIAFLEDFSFTPFPKPCGSGFGFDIGFSGVIKNNLQVAISITDIGSINWDNNTAIIKGSGSINFTGVSTKEKLDSLADEFKKVENKIGASFSSSLPTTLRIGASYSLDKAPFIKSFPGSMTVSVDYNQGFNNEIGNTTKPRFSLGIDWKPMNWIPYIRTGISVGGLMGFEWAFGLGFMIGPLELNFATMHLQSLLAPSLANKLSFAMQSSWSF